MAYHAGTRKVLLVGGSLGLVPGTNHTPLNGPDTWAWDGAQKTWTKMNDLPSPRIGAALVEYGSNVLMFGGLSGSHISNGLVTDGQLLSDTRLWDGAVWVDMNPVHHPPARYFGSMANDTVRREAVLTGGSTTLWGTNLRFRDTWLWDGRDWRQPAPPTALPSTPFSTVFDPSIQQTVAFVQDRVWTWDGTTWIKRESTQGSPQIGLAVYDAFRQQVFGIDASGGYWTRVAPRLGLALNGPLVVVNDPGTRSYQITIPLKNQGNLSETVIGITSGSLSGSNASPSYSCDAGPWPPGATGSCVVNFPNSVGSGAKLLKVTGLYSSVPVTANANWSVAAMVVLP